MTNIEVAQAFALGRQGRSLNMSTDGHKLYSYNTVIMQWSNGMVVVNETKYSRTTSKQLSQSLSLIDGPLCFYIRFVPINTTDLTDYIIT